MDVPARHFVAPCRRRSLLRGNWAILPLLVLLAAGCATTKGVTVREVPRNELATRLNVFSKKGPQPTARTRLLLRRYDLEEVWKRDPKETLAKLQGIMAREPSADKVAAYGELAYLVGYQIEPKDPNAAFELYACAVAHAYQFLFDERLGADGNPYDPLFRETCDLYNGALESVLRVAKKDHGLLPGSTRTVQVAGKAWDITVVSRVRGWHAEDIEKFEFVADYKITGLQNRYRNYGLGVPLIAVRQDHPDEGAGEKFYPPGLSFPVTAMLRTLPDEQPKIQPTSTGGPVEATHHRAVIELYDPLDTPQITCGKRMLPLESDLSTPLAYFLDNPNFNDNSLSTAGLLSPGDAHKLSGVYMLEPYDPNKIPVLFVHGLWSSPITWMEMFNDLRSQPEIRQRYQFWFYLYPTGQPFWISARMLREELAQLRQAVDPQRQAPALDQMVMVGHSMGGLVSRLQTVDSGDAYWDLVAKEPLDKVKADPQVREVLSETYYFHPSMSVRRIVTIGTPFRGSAFANDTTRWLSHKLITLPQRMLMGEQQLRKDNPGIFRSGGPLDVATSIDALAPDSPILPVMLASKRPPWIKHHNIVGMVPQRGIWGEVAGKGDGVVEFTSAHLDDVDSEIVVAADHSSIHRHPRAVLEVRRVLLEHLAELDGRAPGEGPAPVRPDPILVGPGGVGFGPDQEMARAAMPAPAPSGFSRDSLFAPPPAMASPPVAPKR